MHQYIGLSTLRKMELLSSHSISSAGRAFFFVVQSLEQTTILVPLTKTLYEWQFVADEPSKTFDGGLWNSFFLADDHGGGGLVE